MKSTNTLRKTQRDGDGPTKNLNMILGLSQGQNPTVKDLSLLLEIDLKLGRTTDFYKRLHNAMDFLLEQAESQHDDREGI